MSRAISLRHRGVFKGSSALATVSLDWVCASSKSEVLKPVDSIDLINRASTFVSRLPTPVWSSSKSSAKRVSTSAQIPVSAAEKGGSDGCLQMGRHNHKADHSHS